jgi:maltose phosphorylase
MLILFDEKTKLFEQHQGYFDLPHIDIHSIPVTDFPLYHHWSYDRIYRNDMIKQPDVLMFMLLFNQDFPYDVKKANYEFYEPRCIHESSLSPSVHSILASELHKDEEALNFFAFATRMDLDDYNRNSEEGLHTTSIAAAWMNIVYGFGGLRSDGDVLTLNPSKPKIWKRYAFKINYSGEIIKIDVNDNDITIEKETNKPINLRIYGNNTVLDKTLKINLKR